MRDEVLGADAADGSVAQLQTSISFFLLMASRRAPSNHSVGLQMACMISVSHESFPMLVPYESDKCYEYKQRNLVAEQVISCR